MEDFGVYNVNIEAIDYDLNKITVSAPAMIGLDASHPEIFLAVSVRDGMSSIAHAYHVKLNKIALTPSNEEGLGYKKNEECYNWNGL